MEKPAWNIERFDTRADSLIPPDAEIEVLAEGFEWAEGPLWDPDRDGVLFSDVPRNVVHFWTARDGVSDFLRPSGFTGTGDGGREPGSNGLIWDERGRLLLCQHGDRRVARLLEDGTFETIAGSYQGRRFNSPNDLVLSRSGDIYFTDPPYGLEGLNDSPDKELPFNGVYRIDREGRVHLLTEDLSFPNGLAFSPDGSRLYVANSDPQRAIWMVYSVAADGGLEEGRVFFDATDQTDQLPGLPDGLKVDERGNLFATGPGGVSVFSPEGDLLARIGPGAPAANCAWGGDGSDLYITADSYLCRISLTTKGSSWKH